MSSPIPFNDARERLQAADLGVPIEWPNETFSAPAEGIWLAMDMSSDILEPIDIGAGAWVEEGTLMVDVIAPTGWGTDGARQIAKSVANIFRGVTSGGISYVSASLGSGGRDPERGKYWVLAVRVQWRYQDFTVSE